MQSCALLHDKTVVVVMRTFPCSTIGGTSVDTGRAFSRIGPRRRPGALVHGERPRGHVRARFFCASSRPDDAQPSQTSEQHQQGGKSSFSRRELVAGGLTLPPALALCPAALAAELKTLPTDKQYMVGVFRRGVPSFEDWYDMTFGDTRKTKS